MNLPLGSTPSSDATLAGPMEGITLLRSGGAIKFL
jgi:hypothetical protein